MNRRGTLIVSSLGLLMAAGIAYAATSTAEDDVRMIGTAKVSLVQAVTVAEQHLQGQATRAEFEHSRHGWTYDVEVVKGDQVFDVQVDADQGTVLASTEDRRDRDDERDEKD